MSGRVISSMASDSERDDVSVIPRDLDRGDSSPAVGRLLHPSVLY